MRDALDLNQPSVRRPFTDVVTQAFLYSLLFPSFVCAGARVDLVSVAGFEPTALRFQGGYSTRLSYTLYWMERHGSNVRPSESKSDILPTELRSIILYRATELNRDQRDHNPPLYH